MIKRKDLVDPRMKYTDEEISLYNAKAYNSIGTGMVILKGSKNWVPPQIIRNKPIVWPVG